MPTPTLVATAGAANANSYCLVSEAQAYFDSHLYPDTWNAGSPTGSQIVALIMATRALDSMYDWQGYPTNPAVQVLQWPRVGLFQRNRIALVDQTTIPQELKNATAELAQQLMVENRELDSDIETKGLEGITAGPISLRFKSAVYAKVVPDAVFYLLVPWWGNLRSRTPSTREVQRA